MIKLSADELESIEKLDETLLNSAVERAKYIASPDTLRELELYRLGEYVRQAEVQFQAAVAKHLAAKTAAKFENSKREVSRAGSKLISRVNGMKYRAKQERKDGLFFSVSDHVREPLLMRPEMSISVSYRWRTDPNSEWQRGQITFFHKYSLAPQFGPSYSPRKRSVAQRERELAEKLYREWCHFRDIALFSVRDYFREGGKGSDIPESFRAISAMGCLNNHSLKFWL